MKKLNIFCALAAALSVVFGAHGAMLDSTQVQHPQWLKNAVIYEVNLRQGTTGRNIKSFAKELQRLKDLGVDILWLMPIHPISELNRKGELGSYYAVADYKAVNPEFGTLADMKALVQQAHALGMKIILDEVCNHSGCDNAWVTERADFYVKDKDGKMVGPYDWTDTYKFDYSNPDMRAAMMDALKYWVKEVDIDGYRCDVAMEVPTDFWNSVRAELQQIKPIFMLAEASKPELTLKAFDADYNWPMKDVFNAIAATQGVNAYAVAHKQNLPKMSALNIDSLLARQKKEYPAGAINMLMITNHDLNSWEGTEFDRLGKGVGAFAVLSYTLPGVPMLYTGQEVGFNHSFEFFKQDSIQPDYKSNEFTTFYEVLNALRHKNPALWSDKASAPMQRYATTDSNVYVFSRERDGKRVVVVANLSSAEAPVEYKSSSPSMENVIDVFTGLPAKMPAKLAPWQYVVFSTPLE